MPSSSAQSWCASMASCESMVIVRTRCFVSDPVCWSCGACLASRLVRDEPLRPRAALSGAECGG